MRLPMSFAALLVSGSVLAQVFPAKPITLIAPFAPGGPTDTIARIMAERLRASLGQTVVVENVSGAGGTIGAARVAKAAPDGYTLVLGQWTSHVGSPVLYPIQYDTIADFAPVAMLTAGPLIIVGRTSLPAKDVRELVAWFKANPNTGSGATTGVGGGAHLCLLDFQNRTGIRFQLVPYRGGAPVMQDLLSGTVDVSCLEASQTVPHVKAGKMRAYGIAGKRRWFVLPDVPTMEESGVPGLDMPFWHAIWAPKGTPADVIAKLNGAVVDAFADPAIQKRFTDMGHEIPTRENLTPQALGAFHRAEVERWWPVIKAADLKASGN